MVVPTASDLAPEGDDGAVTLSPALSIVRDYERWKIYVMALLALQIDWRGRQYASEFVTHGDGAQK